MHFYNLWSISDPQSLKDLVTECNMEIQSWFTMCTPTFVTDLPDHF